jgi:hypothetical protein
MSADNGIYILESISPLSNDNDDPTHEYRVIEAQAIDNIFYHPDSGPEDTPYHPHLVQYFNQSQIYQTKDEAYTEAQKMYDRIMDDDYGIIEYGISEIHIREIFPTMALEQANAQSEKDSKEFEKIQRNARKEQQKQDELRYQELIHQMSEIICKSHSKSEDLRSLKQQYPHNMYIKALEQYFLEI